MRRVHAPYIESLILRDVRRLLRTGVAANAASALSEPPNFPLSGMWDTRALGAPHRNVARARQCVPRTARPPDQLLEKANSCR